MYKHKMIADLEYKLGCEFYFDPDFNDITALDLPSIISKLKSSPEFFCGEIDETVKSGSLLPDISVCLPYKSCCFSFFIKSNSGRSNISVLTSESDDFFTFCFICSLKKSVYSIIFCDLSKNCLLVNQLSIRSFNDISDGGYRDSIYETFVGAVLIILQGLHCKNIYTKQNLPSEKLNKKRSKKGKLPFYEYKTLHLSADIRTIDLTDHGGSHASPRIHLRRAHARRLASGMVVNIKPCVVGDKTRGIIDKDYTI